MDKTNFKKILIVDDDPAIQKVLKIQLENSGLDCRVAKSGDEALVILKKEEFSPDCILSDINMPGLNGLDLLPQLRVLHPLVPVIMLTAHTDLETGLQAMRLGAFDYITKPVRKLDLIETLKKGLQYRGVLIENQQLALENKKYQEELEKRVEERTRELIESYQTLKETNLATVRVLAETIEAKDPYTRGHCNRVRILSRETARHFKLPPEEIESLEYAALLHDIGKIGIPGKLLNKHESLNPEETLRLQEHPILGEKILSHVAFFKPCLSIVRNHHEWYNGEGYPDGLIGKETNFLSKIVQLVDAFDAMTSNRPYRNAMLLEDVLEELKRFSGSQFDPEIVDMFISKKVYLTNTEEDRDIDI